MAQTESMEMYLETVYIIERDHGHAHVVDIAKKLDVSKPSVTKAMKLLKEKGLINKEAYGSITLTDEGRTRSENIYKQHRIITHYLEHSLGLSFEEAAQNACRMEHVLSKTMVDAIEDYIQKNEIKVTL